MRYRYVLPAIVLTSACALAGAAAVVRAAPQTPAPQTPASQTMASQTAARGGAGPGSALWLPGGPAIEASGGTNTVLSGGGSLRDTMMSLAIGGSSYQIPVDALPYLGHGLDPALFNTADLLTAEKSGQLAIQLSYTGQLPSIPGVTITSSGGGTADGYLTKSSDQAFAAALASQYLADRGHARSGTDGMFDGVTIGLPDTASPAPAASAQGADDTITLTGTNLAGQPDTGDAVFLVNVDNSSITGNPRDTGSSFDQGSTTFSEPAGHYFAIADFVDTSSDGTVTGERVVTVPQFTVSGNKTVHLDERTADSEISFGTPRPATLQATEYEVVRTPVTGSPISFGFFDQQPTSAWVAPTSTPVTTGALTTYADGWLTSPASAATTPYQYNLADQGPAGVIPSGQYTVAPATLATVHARYFSAVPESAYLVSTSWFPYQASAFPPFVQRVQLLAPYIPVSLPQERTEYFSAGPTLQWDTLLSDSGPEGGSYIEAGPFGTYSAGQQSTENWNDYPQHPGASANLTGSLLGTTLPSATRQGDLLSVNVWPFTDNTPSHFSEGLEPDPPGTTVSGSYRITQNGTSVASGALNDGSAFVNATLTPDPATVAVTIAATRTGPAYPLSTKTVTTWTWRTAHESGSTLPAGWYCADGSADCDAEPMMTLEYDVAGLALTGTAPAGPQTLGITPGHILPAAGAAITGVKAQVSFDGGTTWQPAAVTGSGSSYQARYTAPAGSLVTLKVTATDAAGGQISETITSAYRTGKATD